MQGINKFIQSDQYGHLDTLNVKNLSIISDSIGIPRWLQKRQKSEEESYSYRRVY